MRALLAGLLLVLVSGCTLTGGSPSAGPPTAAPSSPAPRSTSPGPGADPATNAAVCAEVRAGIGAFNSADFAGTVAAFQRALPLAEAQVRDHDSAAADDLLAAVRYYARLAPDAYVAAAASSPEFAKYKAITLGQCERGAPDDGPSSDGGGVTI